MCIPHNSTYSDSTTIFYILEPPEGGPQITGGGSWLYKENIHAGVHYC